MEHIKQLLDFLQANQASIIWWLVGAMVVLLVVNSSRRQI